MASCQQIRTPSAIEQTALAIAETKSWQRCFCAADCFSASQARCSACLWSSCSPQKAHCRQHPAARRPANCTWHDWGWSDTGLPVAAQLFHAALHACMADFSCAPSALTWAKLHIQIPDLLQALSSASVTVPVTVIVTVTGTARVTVLTVLSVSPGNRCQ